MRPHIDATAFGSITIEGAVHSHDVMVRLDGVVKKRKKKLSKRRYGTSHTLSVEEAERIHEPGAEVVIVGSGQHGALSLSPEAEALFADHGCAVTLLPTPEAIQAWNEEERAAVGVFHVTC